MLAPQSGLWRWLADQLPFIEVGIGIAFILLLAPAVLAAVALSLTRLEVLLERVAVARPVRGASHVAARQTVTRLPNNWPT
jgi:hypothetical protein